MKKIFDIVTQRNVLFLIISIIFALPFISFTPFVKTVDNVDYFTLNLEPFGRTFLTGLTEFTRPPRLSESDGGQA